ncbi:hypothetical protein HPB48_013207 [Haemaphysalis longicornis]|uniref:Uncharacterized protein n=1 Tax=Haemaphysalis longicornis TaxID=44386 RepID=A0A9J6GLN4_HAELO|nr:hypothetical protein HPB48_013207 [Haemaphysalis longicornis]
MGDGEETVVSDGSLSTPGAPFSQTAMDMKNLRSELRRSGAGPSNSSSSWKNYERVGEKKMRHKTPQCWREVTRGRSCVGTQNGCQERYRSFRQKQKCLSGSRQSKTLWKRWIERLPADDGEAALRLGRQPTERPQGAEAPSCSGENQGDISVRDSEGAEAPGCSAKDDAQDGIGLHSLSQHPDRRTAGVRALE